MTVGAVDAHKKTTHANTKQDGNTTTVTFKADELDAFNKMCGKTKQEIAATFDCQEDIALQDDLRDITGGRGLQYKDLIEGGKYKEQLRKKGIVVKSLGNRMWEVSRVDEKGNVVTNGKGKLAQFKLKDFNSDSYIQKAEFEVNTLLKSAGYDCKAEMKAANFNGSSLNNNDFMDMYKTRDNRNTEPEIQSDNRRLISKGEFNKKVKELKDKEKISDKEAITKLKKRFRVIGETKTEQPNTTQINDSAPGLLEQYQLN